MLNLLDELLRTILMAGVAQLQPVVSGNPPPVTEQQVGFVPPDDAWRATVTGLQRNALNVYLVDLRENRKLRSNERERRTENGAAFDDPAPLRLDSHYLISAWSPSEALTPSVEPTLDEHMLLYQAAAALVHAVPFNPARVYPANSAPLNAWPPRFQAVDLPATVAPAEGFLKLAEFWGAMGREHRWKPALYLIVTVPVELITESAGAIVTTRITEYRQAGKPATAEVWVQIGGTVFDAAGGPVAGAQVRLETIAADPLQNTQTDAQGRFTFGQLHPGTYQLQARALGLGDLAPPRVVEVPSPTGEYDLKF